MYSKEWFKRVVMEEKRKSYPTIDTTNPSAYPNREYIWFFMCTPISPFMRGYNRTCRWVFEEQDKYNPKYCDLYFRPTPDSKVLIKVENVHNHFI